MSSPATPGATAAPNSTGSTVAPAANLLPGMLAGMGYGMVSDDGADRILAEMGFESNQRVANTASMARDNAGILAGMSGAMANLETGEMYTVRAGDTLTGILGTGNTRALGNFAADNRLTSSSIRPGQPLFKSDNPHAYAGATALGQSIYNQDNRVRELAMASSSMATTGGSRFGGGSSSPYTIGDVLADSNARLDALADVIRNGTANGNLPAMVSNGPETLQNATRSYYQRLKNEGQISWSSIDPHGRGVGGDIRYAYDGNGDYRGSMPYGAQDDSGSLFMLAGGAKLVSNVGRATLGALDRFASRSIGEVFDSGMRFPASGAAGEGSLFSPNKVRDFSYFSKKLPADLVEDARGTYGYMPKEGTQFSGSKWTVDWTNPEQVGAARATRLDYHQGLANEGQWIEAMKMQGASDMEIADGIVNMRNQI